jgi:hypothetical protein
VNDPNSGEGWYEWHRDGGTTLVAYVHESGEVYDPELGWNPSEFTLAASAGRVHRLIRADDADVLAEALSDLIEAEDEGVPS